MSTEDIYFSECLNFGQLIEVENCFFNKIYALRGDPAFTGSAPFQRALPKICEIIKDKARKPFLLSIKIPIPVPRLNGNSWLRIGSKFQPDERLASYSMAIHHGGVWKCKLRFDFDAKRRALDDKKESHPFSHIQLGGDLAKDEVDIGCDKRWDDDIDIPRIPCMPCSSAILWHFAFLQFKNTPSFNRFLKSHWWNNIIIDAEAQLWGSYFTDLNAIVQHKNGINKSALESLFFPPERPSTPSPSSKQRNR
jgi:hypothetical protein